MPSKTARDIRCYADKKMGNRTDTHTDVRICPTSESAIRDDAQTLPAKAMAAVSGHLTKQ